MRCRESLLNFESEAPLVHHELSIDSELFTARVYKRNYLNFIVRNLLRRAQHLRADPQEASNNYSTDSARNAEEAVQKPDLIPHRNSNSVMDNDLGHAPAMAVTVHELSATPITSVASCDASKTNETDPAEYAEEVVSVSKRQGTSTSLPSGSSSFIDRDLPQTPQDPDYSTSSSRTCLTEDHIWICPKWKVGDTFRTKVQGPQLMNDFANIYFYSWKTVEEWCVSLQGAIHHHSFFQKMFKEGHDFPKDWLRHCLMAACLQGHGEIVVLVVKHDINFESVRHEVGRYYSHNNPIELALHHGHMDVVKLLVRERRSMADCRRLGPALLRAALNRSDPVMLAAVIEHDVSINHRYRDGMRPIHLACQRGTRACINILVEAGVNLDAVDDEGITARQHVLKATCQRAPKER